MVACAPDRPRRVAAVTITTDRNLWRLTAIVALLLWLASLAYLAATGTSSLRIAVNEIVCATYLVTGLLRLVPTACQSNGSGHGRGRAPAALRTGAGRGRTRARPGRRHGRDGCGSPPRIPDPVVPVGRLRSKLDRGFLAVSAVALTANLVGMPSTIRGSPAPTRTTRCSSSAIPPSPTSPSSSRD